MSGTGKLLIALSAESVTLAHWRRGAMTWNAKLPNDEGGIADCREALARHRGTPCEVLVDAVEEDYRTEVLPHARGADRRELVARKLKQHYRNTPYAAAERQSRETTGRRDDRYQFVALTHPELLEPWIALLDELALPLAGIYLLPMAGVALVRKLEVAAPHVMLVASTSGGLRLSYFRAGQFRLSRLTRLDVVHGRDRAQLYVDEIANTRLYLHALQAAALDDPLAIVLLDPQGTDAEAQKLVAAESPSLECLRLSSGEIARLQKKKGIAAADTADLVYLHLLALRAPGHNLAPESARVAHRRLLRRTAIHRVSAGLAACTVLACIWGAWRVSQTEQRIALAAGERVRYDEQYAAVTRSFPAAPASAAALEQAVAAAQRLNAGARTPQHAFAIVSQALADSPGIVLNGLTWKDGRTAVRSGASTGQDESVLVAGEVRPFSGDYRAAVGAIRKLASDLGRDAGVREVRVVRLPLDVDPSVALSGNTRDSSEPAGTAEFAIELTLKART